MARTDERDEPPYLRIATELRRRIDRGELRPGDRVPSTRQLVREWGVAMATATKALATLRQLGVVEAKAGVGTVVRAGPAQVRRPPRPVERTLTTDRMVRAAITIADAEGLDALSMRRLAAELGVGPMSLYRYVSGKDELVRLMLRAVFVEGPLPEPGPEGWRAKLEFVSRLQWDFYRRHPWLPQLVSMTRPVLVPETMAHTEWTLRALDGLGLSRTDLAREAVALPAFVRGLALSMAAEAEAEHTTGQTAGEWWAERDAEVHEATVSGGFPRLATMDNEVIEDLDGIFEYGLARHLDGLETLIAQGVSRHTDRDRRAP